jgi:hypothetical protein
MSKKPFDPCIHGVDGQPLTNEKFIERMMMFSRRGALIQGFIMEALDFYAKQVVAAAEAGQLNQEKFGLVPVEAWEDCAREILEKLEKRRGS